MPKKSKSSGAVAASIVPDEMSGGLADDFDAEVVKVRYVPWDYDGKSEQYGWTLSVAVHLRPLTEDAIAESLLEEDGTYIQHYSSGSLEHFLPANGEPDDLEPVDFEGWDGEDPEEVEGEYAMPTGSRTKLSNQSNWAHFIVSALEAGFDRDRVVEAQGSVACFEGASFHFDQLEQKKRSGIVVDEEEEGQRRRTVLLPTAILEGATTKGKGKSAKPAAAAKSKAKVASKSKKAAEAEEADESEDSDLADRVNTILVEAIAGAGEDGLSKAKIPGLIIPKFKGAEKKQALTLATDPDHLGGSELWVYDAEDEVLYEAG